MAYDYDQIVQELDILAQQLEQIDEDDEDSVSLALTEAKRVRRGVTIVIRNLAQARDNLQP